MLPYGAVDELDPASRTVLVDVAGDAEVHRAIHERLGNALARSILVGFTRRRAAAGDAPLPGPAPEFFFAPHAIASRGRELAGAFAAAWEDFAPVLARALRIERVAGGDALVQVYRRLLDGGADPSAGYVATLQP